MNASDTVAVRQHLRGRGTGSWQSTASHCPSASLQNSVISRAVGRRQDANGVHRQPSAQLDQLPSSHTQPQHTASGPSYTLRNSTLWCAATWSHAAETIAVARALSAVLEHDSGCMKSTQLLHTGYVSLATAEAALSACQDEKASLKSPLIVTPAPATIRRRMSPGLFSNCFAQWQQAVGVRAAGGRRKMLASIPTNEIASLGRRGAAGGAGVGLPAVLGMVAIVVSCIGTHPPMS